MRARRALLPRGRVVLPPPHRNQAVELALSIPSRKDSRPGRCGLGSRRQGCRHRLRREHRQLQRFVAAKQKVNVDRGRRLVRRIAQHRADQPIEHAGRHGRIVHAAVLLIDQHAVGVDRHIRTRERNPPHAKRLADDRFPFDPGLDTVRRSQQHQRRHTNPKRKRGRHTNPTRKRWNQRTHSPFLCQSTHSNYRPQTLAILPAFALPRAG